MTEQPKVLSDAEIRRVLSAIERFSAGAASEEDMLEMVNALALYIRADESVAVTC